MGVQAPREFLRQVSCSRTKEITRNDLDLYLEKFTLVKNPNYENSNKRKFQMSFFFKEKSNLIFKLWNFN